MFKNKKNVHHLHGHMLGDAFSTSGSCIKAQTATNN